MKIIRCTGLLAVLLICTALTALDTTELSSQALQQRYHELTHELRCLVCQNESIAASSAPLAKDLRQKVAEQLEAGKSDEQIRRFMTDRYGEFVTYRPATDGPGRMLWLAPLVLLLISIPVFVLVLRSNQVQEDE